MISWMLLLAGVWGAFEGDFPSALDAGRGGPDPSRLAAGDPGGANPALAGGLSSVDVGVNWTRPLGLDGLDAGGLWARVPLGPVVGMGVRWRSLLAEDVYREDQVAVDLGARRGWAQFGCGGRWGRVEVAGQDLGQPVGWAAGLALEPHAQARIGASWEDPSGLAPSGIALPWTARTAASWISGDSGWTATVGGSWRQEGAWSWELGQEWSWDPVRFRLGMRTDPIVLCVGLGFSWKGARLDWGMQGESKFGWQQHLGASWGF